MTINEFIELIQAYNIPKNATIEANTEWECGPKELIRLYYNPVTNIILATCEKTEKYDRYSSKYYMPEYIQKGWIALRKGGKK